MDPINFSYPDEKLFHSLFGLFLVRYVVELEKRGIVTVNNEEMKETVDATTDIFADKFIEIMKGERAFNW